MQRIWLIFAQTVTVALGVLFVVATLRPEWLPQRAPALTPAVTDPNPAAPAEGLRPSSYSEAVRRAAPAVVSIFTSKQIRTPRSPYFSDPLLRRFFGNPDQRAFGLGSGVLVSREGYVLTNHHVVEAADEIEVALADGKKLGARLIGSDPDSDLAVLRVPGDNLPAVAFGEVERLRVGDVVLAIGNPFNVGQTVTMGIVSALGRSGLHINTFENFIQTDAAINPGNSGGALTDVNGNLIGINTAIFSQQPGGASLGIGFAIPASTARQVMEQIIASGSVTRGWIGVEVQEVTAELAESFRLAPGSGVLISGVLRGAPAERAGVKPGDVLLAVEGKPVGDPPAMLNLVAALPPGQSAKFKVRRGEREIALRIDVGRRPPIQRRR